MEFPKHEIFLQEMEPESGIRRSAHLYMQSSPVFQQERDDVTRQRLLFSAILGDHFEVLFNGNANERGPLWEEVRQFMVEQGAMTLTDKDWKYVASCYWQNIRKESIRRMAKMKVGAVKSARPAQLELDRLVGDVINKRGPGSLETVVANYGRTYVDEEGSGQHNSSGAGTKHHEAEKTPVVVLLEEPLSNSASPAAQEEQHFNNSQPILDQLIRNASLKYAQKQQQPQQHQQLLAHQSESSCSSNATASSSVGIHSLASSSNASAVSISGSAVEGVDNTSFQLGKLVAKTHSLLMGGGYAEMAAEFEQQMKQMVNGYKAWMFDQIFPGGNAEEEANNSRVEETPKGKKAKLEQNNRN